jgi:hypothetical protein
MRATERKLCFTAGILSPNDNAELKLGFFFFQSLAFGIVTLLLLASLTMHLIPEEGSEAVQCCSKLIFWLM